MYLSSSPALAVSSSGTAAAGTVHTCMHALAVDSFAYTV